MFVPKTEYSALCIGMMYSGSAWVKMVIMEMLSVNYTKTTIVAYVEHPTITINGFFMSTE